VIRAVATSAESPPLAGTPPLATAAGSAAASAPVVAQSAGRPAVDAALAAKLAPPQPLEARLAALRAASPPPVPPPRPPPVSLPTARTGAPPPSLPTIRPSGFVAPPLIRPSGTAASEPVRITPGSPKPIGQGVASVNSRFAAISPHARLQSRTPIENPVPIRTRGDTIASDTTRAVPRGATAAAGTQAAHVATATTTVAKPAAQPVRAEAFRDPSVLLRALRVPVTQTNLASATLALQSPQRVPAALAALERALPDGRSDPRVATLRTIVGFVNRLDPQSPTLAAQIAAYVSHVVDGAEPKLATLLQSYAAHADPTAAPPAAAFPAYGSNENATTTASGASASPAAAAPAALAPAPPTLAAAQTLIAAAALDHDLKTMLQTLLITPTAGTAATPTAAIQTALTALTGVQLDVANTLAQIPLQVTFTIPLPLVHPDAQARVTIDRKRHDDPTQAIDGDNFHIAFILTTKHLGTVTIDLRTVGRAVNVGVHTEAELAAQTFGGALARLKNRLESLRYNVTSIESGVAPRRTEPALASSAQAAEIDAPEIASSDRASEAGPDVDKIA
jgi:S-DNA-T family DNA segregation ATPase FtsK/SpoIIIE